MAIQRKLFDDERPPKLARDTDPETSHDSAAEMLPKLGKLESRLLFAFLRICRDLRQSSAREAAEIAYRNHRNTPGEKHEADSYRKRTRSLLDKGMIKADGAKVCRISGKTVTAYRIKDD